jgi:hypothetical protein
MESTAAMAFVVYIRPNSLFKSESLSTKLILYKTPILSIMIYACPTWEHATNAQLLKLQRLQNRVLSIIGNPDRCTPFCDLQVAFKIPKIYDYITTLCRKQAEVEVCLRHS